MSSTREPELDRDVPDIAALKQGPRVMWAAGDYPTLAARMPSRGVASARRAGADPGVRPGEDRDDRPGHGRKRCRLHNHARGTGDPLHRVLLHDETAFRTADSHGNAPSGDRAVYPIRRASARRASAADPSLPWEERLRALADGIRETAIRHPDAFLLLLRQPVATAAALGVREAVYAALRDAGVTEALVPRLERLLSTFVIGFAASEAGGRFAAHQKAVRDGDFEWAWEQILGVVEVERPQIGAGR